MMAATSKRTPPTKLTDAQAVMLYDKMLDLLSSPDRWIQSREATTEDGASVHAINPMARCFCIDGARRRAVNSLRRVKKFLLVGEHYPKAGLRYTFEEISYSTLEEDFCRMRRRSMISYNDEYGRTHSEVVETLRLCRTRHVSKS